MKTINEAQDLIVKEFSGLRGDFEKFIMLLVGKGKELSPMPDEDKNSTTLIRGCHSNVWVKASYEHDKIYFIGDSDTAIVKGLISLIIEIFNGQAPDDILGAELFFIDETGLQRYIGKQRSVGVAAIVDHIKLYAASVEFYEG